MRAGVPASIMMTDVWSSIPAEDDGASRATADDRGDQQEEKQQRGAWIGVDFGTSNSCVALWHPEKHRAKIIKNTQERRVTPSVAFLRSEDDILVGNDALDEWSRKADEGALVTSVKRVIGRNLADHELAGLAPSLPFRVIESFDGDKPGLVLRTTTPKGAVLMKRPEDISALILKSLRESVEAYLVRKPFPGVPGHVDRAVITVPAHFNEAQKAAIRQAGKLAGFKQVTLLSEPFAAAMAYGLFIAGEKLIMTFDIGGGTTDTCVLRLVEGSFEVLAMEGDNHLGGEDMDYLLFQHVVRNQGVEPSKVPSHVRTSILSACTRAKVELSTSDKATIELPPGLLALSAAKGGGGRVKGDEEGEKAVAVTVTRSEFEEMIDGLVKRAKAKVETALAAAGLGPEAIDEVILVGGGSRIPAVRKMLLEVFGEGLELCTAINPDEAVAQGAAIRAAILSGVDPAILRDVLMLDVIPLSISLETADGGFEVMLPKNERIPCQVTKYFEVDARQKIVQLQLREGESEEAEENALIATVDLPIWHHMVPKDGDPPLKEGHQHHDDDAHPPTGLIAVTVEMDANGRLTVSLGDPSKGEEDGGAFLAPSTLPLILYCIVLFALYITAKLYFADDLPSPPAITEL